MRISFSLFFFPIQCGKKLKKMEFKKEYSRFNSRKPEFNRTFRITIGVIAVNFHLRTFFMANGIAGPFASCAANVMYGGTYGKSDGANGHPSGV